MPLPESTSSAGRVSPKQTVPPKNKKSEIIKEAGMFAAASYSSTLFDMVNGVLVRNLVGPASMGVWAFLQVIINYSKYASLGTGPALVREIPFYRGSGNFAEAEKIKNNVFNFSLVVSLMITLAIIGYALWNRGHMSPEMTYGLIAVALIVTLQRIFNLYVVFLRAFKMFHIASISTFLSSAVLLALTLLFTKPFGYYGLLISTVLAYALNAAYIHWAGKFKFKAEMDPKILKGLATFGVSLISIDLCMTLLKSIDDILIVKMINFEALGFYSIAIMFQTYLTILPNLADMVLNPYLFEKAGHDPDPRKVKNYVLQPAYTMSCMMPLCILVTWCFAPWVVTHLVPRYTPGIPALQILIFSTYFLGISRPLSAYLVLLKKHMLQIPILLFSSLVAFSMIFIAIGRLRLGIEGVAFSMVVSFGLYFVILFLVTSCYLLKPAEIAVAFLKIMAPFFYIFVPIHFFGKIMMVPPHAQNLVMRFVSSLGLCAAFSIPLIWQFERETQLVSHWGRAARTQIGRFKLFTSDIEENDER